MSKEKLEVGDWVRVLPHGEVINGKYVACLHCDTTGDVTCIERVNQVNRVAYCINGENYALEALAYCHSTPKPENREIRVGCWVRVLPVISPFVVEHVGSVYQVVGPHPVLRGWVLQLPYGHGLFHSKELMYCHG